MTMAPSIHRGLADLITLPDRCVVVAGADVSRSVAAFLFRAWGGPLVERDSHSGRSASHCFCFGAASVMGHIVSCVSAAGRCGSMAADCGTAIYRAMQLSALTNEAIA